MSQQIEIEFKNLLTESEFTQLQQYFQINKNDFFKQVNHYFDTPAFSLKKSSQALRIREKNNEFELTLKQPANIGLLETNQPISKKVYNQMAHTGELPAGQIKTILSKQLSGGQALTYFGSLTTFRAEKEYKGGLLVLDHSCYLNKEDYEVEYEVRDPIIGQTHFHTLLQEHQIPLRKTENKVVRFYQRKKSRLG